MIGIAAEKMSEAELDAAIRQLCDDLDLYAYHTHDSRRCPPGFPDWIIIGGRGMIFRECKSEHGPISREQRRVGYLLQSVRQSWGIWRPSDLISGHIRRELLLQI